MKQIDSSKERRSWTASWWAIDLVPNLPLIVFVIILSIFMLVFPAWFEHAAAWLSVHHLNGNIKQ